ncbi:MAG TPA: DUF6485 family protein [Candidatus Wallbacteria bacterium]|nr:DUF6485 family protein [Candidatus Wallbacteria bacterium]
MECKKKATLAKCTCTYEPCSRKGACCDCIEYHRGNNEVPGCLFSKAGERTYDRSVSNFIRDRQKNQ